MLLATTIRRCKRFNQLQSASIVPNTEGAPRKTVTWCLTTNNASQFGRQFAKHQLITDHHRTLSVCIVLLIYPLIELNLVAQ